MSLKSRLPTLIAKQWFLLLLIGCLVVGLIGATPLRFAAESKSWQNWVVASVMFAMALPLEFSIVRRVLSRPTAPLLASVINLGVTPLVAWPISFWLGPELGPGLIVAAATPCTLASAAVWTRRANGNDAVAVMVTLITNLLCFCITPAWIRLLTSAGAVQFELAPIVGQLFGIVVLPILLGQGIRLVPAVREWGRKHARFLSVYCQLGILSIVLVGAVKTGQRLSVTGSTSLSIHLLAGCLVAVLVIHNAMLLLGVFAARRLNCPPADQIAVAFAGSQKTLMVGLSAAIQIGFSIIPLVMFHMSQLICDTLIADWLRARGARSTDTTRPADRLRG